MYNYCIDAATFGGNNMYREIMNELILWKDRNNRKPLLVSGVRQCGKTYIIKEFGNNCFDNLASCLLPNCLAKLGRLRAVKLDEVEAEYMTKRRR